MIKVITVLTYEVLCNTLVWRSPHSKEALMHIRTSLMSEALIAALSASPLSFATETSTAPEPSRTVTESSTGAQLHIEGEGSCSSLRVSTTYEQGTSNDVFVEYDITDDCRVANIRWRRTYFPRAARALSATNCNWIHSSQTVQDVVNIDIAKHRFHTNRCWSVGTSRMTDWKGESSTSVAWNHTSGSPTVIRFDGGWSKSASAQSSAKFHTDWTWCNFKVGWQSIELRNTHISNGDGTYSVSFWQNRSCPGTHMATASKQSSSSTW